MISAVVLSAKEVEIAIPGVVVVPHVSVIQNAKELLDARLEALKKVRSEWFFFLDDDDSLPDDYLKILDRCVSVDTPLAYTDELITNADGSLRVRKSAPYSEDAFIRNSTLIHHLAVCRTEAALEAAAKIPRGTYAIENLLFFEVARQGATYIPEIGYIWNRRKTGLNRGPSIVIGLVRSACWANRNRSIDRG